MSAKTVAELLDEIGTKSPSLHAIATALRDLVHDHAPLAEEEVKYGGIFYSHNRPVCGIYSLKKHITLEFSRGAEFDDGGLLGDGAYRRHLKFLAPSEIDRESVGRYIAEAYSRA